MSGAQLLPTDAQVKIIAAALLCIVPTFVAAQSVNDAGVPATSNFAGFSEPTRGSAAGSGSFDGTEPTMSPRFFRPGVAGDPCGEFASGNFQYQTVDFLTDASGTLDVNFDPGESCGTGIYVTFHTADFNPANICEGFVWSVGSSFAFTESFAVPPNTDMQMVVSGVPNAPGLVCGVYTYDIQGTGTAGVPLGPVNPIPTLGYFGLALLGLMLGLLGLVVVRQQR